MAMALVEQLDPSLCALKVGSEMFTLLGPHFINKLVEQQFNVFLDLKFHDIPNTVARACKVAADLGVWMINVHALGGLKMMDAASAAIRGFGNSRPLLIAVTVLTSMDSKEFSTLELSQSIETQVEVLARLAKQAGLDGVVSSAFEVPKIKSVCGDDFLTITPGIRLLSNLKDDQERVVTPKEAIHLGSDYLVVGRPITRAENPANALQGFLLQMKS
jgi:orotidine-5'-phosphate decarboxylase